MHQDRDGEVAWGCYGIRSLDAFRAATANQFIGIKGCIPYPKIICQPTLRLPYYNPGRQCGSNCLHKSQGGTTSALLYSIALEMWNWALLHQITIHAEHVPGLRNVLADRESRHSTDPCDWELDQRVFYKLAECWGPFNIDLFAARHNAKLQNYFSYQPDPSAIAMDALAQDWSSLIPYAFPPFILDSESPPENEACRN